MANLWTKLQQVPEPPCTGCGHYNECAARALACRTFAAYVHGGDYSRGRKAPSRAIYFRIFRSDSEEEENGKQAVEAA